MPTPPLSDELAQQAADAYIAAHRSWRDAAAAIGIGKATFEHRLKVARRRGMLGPMQPALAGFEVKGYSEQRDKAGNLRGLSTRYGQEASSEAEIPAGTSIKRGTLQIGPDGRVERHWPRYSPEDITPERTAEIIRDAFENFKPFAPAIIRLRNHDEDKLTVYPLADWHVGMFAWGRETDGPDWDLTIARKVLVETFAELVDQTPMSAHAVVLGLGDLMHADSHKNMTPTSNNIMDVDTRYAKCLPTVVNIVAECCEMVRAKHRQVEVAIKAGNHDVSSTVGIREALRMYYRNDGKVSVEQSPSPYYWRRFGVNLICGTHGDGIKIKDLPLFMANVKSADWSEATSRHAHTGHLHSEMSMEHGGVKLHQHRAPIPGDAWHHAQGYRSGRSMRAFHYHKTRGARGASEVEIL